MKSVLDSVYIVCILFTQVLQTDLYQSHQKKDLSLNLLIDFPILTFIILVIKQNQQCSKQMGGEGDRKEDGYTTDEQKEKSMYCSTQPN